MDWNVIRDVIQEYDRATAKFGPFNSAHEGYAVLKEEVDELWMEIKVNSTKKILRGEVVQVAAMALRFIIDVCDKKTPKEIKAQTTIQERHEPEQLRLYDWRRGE